MVHEEIHAGVNLLDNKDISFDDELDGVNDDLNDNLFDNRKQA